jgi:hypothetical protein
MSEAGVQPCFKLVHVPDLDITGPKLLQSMDGQEQGDVLQEPFVLLQGALRKFVVTDLLLTRETEQRLTAVTNKTRLKNKALRSVEAQSEILVLPPGLEPGTLRL